MRPNEKPLAALWAAVMMMPDWRPVGVDARLHGARSGAYVASINDSIADDARDGDFVVAVTVSMQRRGDAAGALVSLSAPAMSPWDDDARSIVRRLVARAAAPERDVQLPLRMELVVGEYTVTEDASGHLRALRHGASWRDLCGDQLVGALAGALRDAQARLGVTVPGAEVVAPGVRGMLVLRHPATWTGAEVARVARAVADADADGSGVLALPLPAELVGVPSDGPLVLRHPAAWTDAEVAAIVAGLRAETGRVVTPLALPAVVKPRCRDGVCPVHGWDGDGAFAVERCSTSGEPALLAQVRAAEAVVVDGVRLPRLTEVGADGARWFGAEGTDALGDGAVVVKILQGRAEVAS